MGNNYAEIDLTGMARGDLQNLQKRIEKQLVTLDREDRKAALAAAEAAARDAGYSLDDLIGGKSPKASGAKNPPKYRDPETGKTWSGRGRRPDWINAVDDISVFEI